MTETIQNSKAKGTSTYVRILLAVVLVLGALLVGGTAVVIGTIISRLTNPEPPAATTTQDLSLPQGARLRTLATTDNRIILHMQQGNDAWLIILNESGEEVSRVRLPRARP